MSSNNITHGIIVGLTVASIGAVITIAWNQLQGINDSINDLNKSVMRLDGKFHSMTGYIMQEHLDLQGRLDRIQEKSGPLSKLEKYASIKKELDAIRMKVHNQGIHLKYEPAYLARNDDEPHFIHKPKIKKKFTIAYNEYLKKDKQRLVSVKIKHLNVPIEVTHPIEVEKYDLESGGAGLIVKDALYEIHTLKIISRMSNNFSEKMAAANKVNIDSL